jgi:hypothetical protein
MKGLEATKQSIGKTIEMVDCGNEILIFSFTDGSFLLIQDKGQNCFEKHYLTCDDDLSYFQTAVFYGLEVRDLPDREGEYGDIHESKTLVVKTSLGEFNVMTHNEHNGFYSGINLIAKLMR